MTRTDNYPNRMTVAESARFDALYNNYVAHYDSMSDSDVAAYWSMYGRESEEPFAGVKEAARWAAINSVMQSNDC
jgi:hypothetical protein